MSPSPASTGSPRVGQQAGEGVVAVAVVRPGSRDACEDLGIRHESVYEPLQEVADPRRAGRQAHREPVGRVGVGGRHREAHVGTEELRHRAHDAQRLCDGSTSEKYGRRDSIEKWSSSMTRT